MGSIPAWVRRAANSRHLSQRAGAQHIMRSAHWQAAVHAIDSGLHAHALLAASHLSKTAIDDTHVPAAMLALQADGTLAEAARWNAGPERIANELLEAALSLDLAGRDASEESVVVLFRLIDRLGELARTDDWYTLGAPYAPWDANIFTVLDARLIAAVLDGPSDWQRVTALYEEGHRDPAVIAKALAAPAALASGSL